MKKIVLASNSPRRKELLEMLGVGFEVIPDNTPEPELSGLSPADTVIQLAKFKGKNVASKLKSDEEVIIISADTVVATENRILGKPKTKEDALEILKSLSGSKHSVYTGVYIIEKSSKKSANFYEKTEVYFKNLDISEIKDYINTGEPMDKAGAYGIQSLGALFVEKIYGDYFNVVGLPLCTLAKTLKEFGIDFLNENTERK